MKVVVVGFKVSEENSVYYQKVDSDDPRFKQSRLSSPNEPEFWSFIGQFLGSACEKGAEFVSVRFIK